MRLAAKLQLIGEALKSSKSNSGPEITYFYNYPFIYKKYNTQIFFLQYKCGNVTGFPGGL
jgi:hypothetical protein